ncbi:hypothetical protein [Gluconobacter roseus]|uniref:Uncharacterized protein n=1 Tax=Gluconobacter roseus NBRC 3990 TaxID=1307950 RepID=A0A4Y3M5L2_9PROT|nr:hypothetical protein [Gluconobacter roseus]KXV43641.1 hypothetical protein AD943_08430 [Gluconobacter roseus]GBR47312.1 hypothetical protein AA3990_1740 [Gluconobacter roseus NBRC 3990]GEB04602.1 hypothetical protein GRO01_21780 [Gluconobacter roseus NBRC 3990]GLP92263.1 hypothetical protein GCM10007871_02410 [Gluconobacter roseus NBRC 3990]
MAKPSAKSAPKVKWRLEDAENRLWEVGIEVSTIEKMPSGHGSVIRTRDGRMVCVYDTGSLTCQGKLMADTKLLFEDPPSSLLNEAIRGHSEALEESSQLAQANTPEEADKPLRPLGGAYSKSRVIVTAKGDPEEVMPWD